MNAARILSIKELVNVPDPFAASSQRDFDAHRLITAQMKRKYKTYLSEVALQAAFEINGEEIIVQGRLDGLCRIKNKILIHEIKPVYGQAAVWRNHFALDGARKQLKLYADLLLHSGFKTWGNCGIGGAKLIMVGESGRSIVEEVEISPESDALARRLKSYLILSKARQKRRFPLSRLHPFVCADIKADRELQAAAWAQLGNAIENELLLSLPPGSGKTRVAARWALHAAGEHGLPIFWITSKARGREEVISEFDRYRKAGIPLRVLWKTSRTRRCSCPNPNLECATSWDTMDALFWDGCPELLLRESWTDADIDDYTREHGLCSYELHRYLEPFADVIVADLNYLIDNSTLKGRRAIVVLDEAQNIVPRLRERLQVSVARDDVINAMRMLPSFLRKRYPLLKGPAAADFAATRDLMEQCAGFSEAFRVYEGKYPSFDILRSIAQIGRMSADSVAMAWCRIEPQPMLVATVLDLSPEIADMLSPCAKWLALSGSLPADSEIREDIFPPSRICACIEVPSAVVPPVLIIPLLNFKHPLSAADHETAVQLLMQIRKRMSPTILVFGQNRGSNAVLSSMLHTRGFSVLLDEDVDADWSRAEFIHPDFLFVAAGGSLAEAVNPPAKLLSCAAVLSPGYQPPDVFTELRRAMRMRDDDRNGADPDRILDIRTQSISRIIQAVGRVQRDPQAAKPVFLLNKDFAHDVFTKAWPRHWYIKHPQEMVCSNLKEALQKAEHHARPS